MTPVSTKAYVMNLGSYEHKIICSANKQTKTFRMGNDSNGNVRPQYSIPYTLGIVKRKGAVTNCHVTRELSHGWLALRIKEPRVRSSVAI